MFACLCVCVYDFVGSYLIFLFVCVDAFSVRVFVYANVHAYVYVYVYVGREVSMCVSIFASVYVNIFVVWSTYQWTNSLRNFTP